MNDRVRFDKFTERARKVLSLAQEEAQRFQHNYIGIEHLLLGLVREGEGVAAKILHHLGVDLQKARQVVEDTVGRGDRIILGEISLTPNAKKAIEFAVDEAYRLNHHYIGTEHLLLGLVRLVEDPKKEEDPSAQVLQIIGVNVEQVRTQTIQVLGQSSSSSRTTRQTPTTAQEIRAMKFDLFTVQAKRVLDAVYEDVQRSQPQENAGEYILLVLLREKDSVATKVLSNLGVDLSNLLHAVEFMVEDYSGRTSRKETVVELAMNEARRLDHHYIGVEHLLLALISEEGSIAARVLESFEISLERARTETIKVLAQQRIGDQPISISPTASASPANQQTGSRDAQPPRDADDQIPEPGQEDQHISQVLTALSQGDDKRFEKFTLRSRRVLMFASEEAQRFQHNYIGTEHLLLGLTRENGGIAAVVLRNLGVKLTKIRNAVEFIIGRGDRIVVGEIGLTPRAKKVCELAADAARRLNQDHIGTEHLLLGLVREGEGIAAGVLESMGVNLERVRIEVLRLMRQSGDA